MHVYKEGPNSLRTKEPTVLISRGQKHELGFKVNAPLSAAEARSSGTGAACTESSETLSWFYINEFAESMALAARDCVKWENEDHLLHLYRQCCLSTSVHFVAYRP